MNKQFMVACITFLLIVIGVSGCFDNSNPINNEEMSDYEGLDARVELSSVLAGALKDGITNDQIANFTRAVDMLSNSLQYEALSEFQNLSDLIGHENLSTLIIDPPTYNSSFFHGLYFTDIREARIALANIDKIKSDGFDTVLIQAQIVPGGNDTILIPGKEVYKFYINAFHASGFRVWLAVAHTSYEFSKQLETFPSENLQTFYNLSEPHILEWANLAENYSVSAFIPLEEPEDFMECGGPPRLSDDQQNALSNWSQELLPKIKTRYSGDIVFAVEDWNSMGSILTPSCIPYDKGPGLNYSGYSYIAVKCGYFNGLARDIWLKDMDARLTNANGYAERDSVRGVVWYEAGTPMSRGLNLDLGEHLVQLTDQEQETVFSDIINISTDNKLKGVFFKLSPEQPHEGTWNFLDKPAEMVLREAFANDGHIEEKPIDNLWVSLGEERLKAIQLAIANDIPFDPDYSLDKGYYDGFYHELELAIDGECIGCELYP